MSKPEISILLVDDDDIIRSCICAYLEDEGFSVHSAVSGEEALEMIAGINPAICISDMRMPGMNGECFIRQAHLICPETGYLLHTGLDYPLSAELRAIGMTADDVLYKPIYELSIITKKINAIVMAGSRI